VLTLAAGFIAGFLDSAVILEMSQVGAVLILGIALNTLALPGSGSEICFCQFLCPVASWAAALAQSCCSDCCALFFVGMPEILEIIIIDTDLLRVNILRPH
jgi:hypothetical protein